jgi:hypothetical protein
MGGFTVMAEKMRGRIVANPILENETNAAVQSGSGQWEPL